MWKAAAILDDGIRQSGETANDAVTLVAPSWIGPSQLFMSAAPARNVQVAILAKHEDHAEMVTVYVGEVAQINFPAPGLSRISCETLTASMRRQGLRLGWQRSCPYALYDPLTCKVDKAAWGKNFRVVSINGFTVVANLIATTAVANQFDNGFLTWTHPTRGVEYIPIETQTGTSQVTLTLMSEPGELFPGATGTMYPGCNFTPASCQAFGNYDNYGGVPDMPGKSPFDGTPVF